MDDPEHRIPFWQTALRIGDHTLPALLLLSGAATFFCIWLAPPLSFVFGTGRFALFFTGFLLFGLFLAFKKIFLKNIYRRPEGDAALIDYLVQQNPGANRQEEEVAVELIENALHLKDVRAADCMAPRPEIVHIDADASVEELHRLFIASQMSRILVSEGGNLDQVAGYVHVQQLFERPKRIRDIVLPIVFMPESAPVNELLHKFIRARTNIACVVDEYGSVAGLITLEDALEQLFGNIDDEYDQEEFIENTVGPKEFLFSGRLKVDYLNEKYPALELPEGDYQTLSGYLMALTQTIPVQGSKVSAGGKTFVFELVSDRKIETIRVLLEES